MLAFQVFDYSHVGEHDVWLMFMHVRANVKLFIHSQLLQCSQKMVWKKCMFTIRKTAEHKQIYFWNISQLHHWLAGVRYNYVNKLNNRKHANLD